MSSLFRINTKGTCLLCLHHPRSSSSHNQESEQRTDAAFKMLLRYLKVDQRKLVHFSSSVMSSSSDCDLDSWNFSVTLCDDCSSVATDFHELFQAYEGIRIQLDLCIGQLHEFMEKGDKDVSRILEYEKRMISSRNVEDLLAASIAESLRKETKEKASRNVKCSLPRISLKEWNTSRNNIKELKKPSENNNNDLAHFPPENTGDKSPDTFSDEGEAVEVDALKENDLLLCTEDESMEMDSNSIEVAVEDVAAPLNVTPDSVNKNDNPVETPNLGGPKISKQVGTTNSTLTCVYCGETFSLKRVLDAHKLGKHSFSFLIDTGRLPSHLSEQKLEGALNAIFSQIKYPSLNCPFCSFGGTILRRHDMRLHTLRIHLNRIIEEMDKLPPVVSRSVLHLMDKNDSVQLQIENQTAKSWKGWKPCKVIQDMEKHENSLPSRKTISKQRLKCDLDQVIGEVEQNNIECASSSNKKVSKFRRLHKCKYCGVVFSGNHLKRHQYSKHAYSLLLEDGLLPPDVSEQQLENALASVLNGASGTGTKCPLCGIGGSSQNSYHVRAHVLQYHLPQVIKRIQKGGRHSNSDEKVKPQQRPQPRPVLSNNMAKYKCNFCGKILHSRQRLKEHYLRLHLQRNTYKCDLCQKRFSLQTSLRRHHIWAHPVVTFYHRLPLGITDQEFTQAVNIVVGEKNNEIYRKYGMRQKLHGTDEKFVCTLCGKKGSSMCELRLHITRTHLDEVVRVLGKLAAESGVKPEVNSLKQESHQNTGECVDNIGVVDEICALPCL